MRTVLIAGAGQLGSRHLQGVKQSEHELDIWAYDPSRDALIIAEERYKQIKDISEKKVHFIQTMEEIPQNIDIAIIASSSKPRYAIVTELLYTHNVRYLILEKFLFPRMSDYDNISSLLLEKKVKAYVNCPRRMYECYDIIKSHIDKNKPIAFSMSGKNWGLCCNSIHFIDIFMYISGEKDYKINLDALSNEVIDSKRVGYIELLGTIDITTCNGHKLTLTSTMEYEDEPRIIIDNGNLNINLNEGTGELNIDGKIYKSELKYQSELSGTIVDQLINIGDCKLTPYNESAIYHKRFLSTIAPFINRIKGWTSDSCPIT